MRYRVGAGTPNHMETKVYDMPSQAKNFLTGRLDGHNEFASKFNRELNRRLGAIREEISNLGFAGLKAGDHRSWHATDEPSGVQFTYEVRVES